MDDEEINKKLTDITDKIDNLYKIVEKESKIAAVECNTVAKEELKIEKILNTVSDKFDEIIKLFKDKKECAEEKIKENPIAYVAGTLMGGILIGYLIKKGTK